MRFFVVAMLGWMSLPAWAQDVGESGFMVREVTSERFAGERTPGPLFEKGKRVMVLYKQGAQVRVAMGSQFGWVPVDAVQAKPVAAPDTPVIDLKPAGE